MSATSSATVKVTVEITVTPATPPSTPAPNTQQTQPAQASSSSSLGISTSSSLTNEQRNPEYYAWLRTLPSSGPCSWNGDGEE